MVGGVVAIIIAGREASVVLEILTVRQGERGSAVGVESHTLRGGSVIAVAAVAVGAEGVDIVVVVGVGAEACESDGGGGHPEAVAGANGKAGGAVLQDIAALVAAVGSPRDDSGAVGDIGCHGHACTLAAGGDRHGELVDKGATSRACSGIHDGKLGLVGHSHVVAQTVVLKIGV